ncbi:MAG: hypothetical protein ABSG63_05215 [Spirochaetia bacterium]|jgi:hypothetical protein
MMLPRLKLSDRITWAVLLWVFLNLIWLRFIEKFVPQWVAAIIFTAAAVAFILFGPRPVDAPDDEDEPAVGAKGEGR